MSKIVQMSAQLANMIAAGEVIERPASVVKELVENAVDASSTKIEVHLLDAGIRQVRVVDNGDGMAFDDVPIAFLRHATSKVKTEFDIFRIQTLGFRGEALPSIASVSDISVKSSDGENEGVHFRIKGGDVLTHVPSSMRKGTDIEVNHLFFNTPARLKHVKSLNTELSHITDYMNKVALAHPEISFKLFNNQRLLFQTNGQNNLQSVIANIYGFDIAKKMIEVRAKTDEFEISGYVSDPIINRASRNYMTLIVNGRAIRHYGLTRSIIDAYHTLLPKDKYPIVVLNLTLEPILVDVNVHPAKLEVRFSQEEQLKSFILTEFKKALSEVQYIPETTFETKKETPLEKPIQQTLQASTTSQAPFHSFDRCEEQSLVTNGEVADFKQSSEIRERDMIQVNHPVTNRDGLTKDVLTRLDQAFTKQEMSYKDLHNPFQKPFKKPELDDDLTLKEINDLVKPSMKENDLLKPSMKEDDLQSKPSVKDTREDARLKPTKEALQINVPTSDGTSLVLDYIGQLHGTYLLAQNEEGLFLIDQHAAMERVQYEQLYATLAQVTPETTELIVPLLLCYTQKELLQLKDKLNVLTTFGFSLETFGNQELIVRQIPVWAQTNELQKIVETLIQTLLKDKQVNIATLRESIAIMMSCKGSIKANQFINDYEVKQLLVDLCACEQPYTCPHGRPIIVKLTAYEIQKLFKRVM